MEDLIINAHTLFDEQHNTHLQSPQSPPLPPTPAGEPAAPYSYGSKNTKVSTVLPPATPDHTARISGPIKASPQDFTPILPPRPANSIHPSLRSGPTSPGRGQSETPPPPLPSRPQYYPSESPPPSPLALPRRSGSEDNGINNVDPFRVHNMVEARSESPLPPIPTDTQSNSTE
jgi:hypothetical protein